LAGDDGALYRRFPAATSVGDLAVFLDVGGSTLEMMNDYNARPRAAAWAVTARGDVVQMRRPETLADLVAFDLTPGCERGRGRAAARPRPPSRVAQTIHWSRTRANL